MSAETSPRESLLDGTSDEAAVERMITVEPHTIRRTIKGYYDRVMMERVGDRTYDEVDVVFPFLARCGSVSAIGKTRDGAVAMVERILTAKETRG